MLHVGEEGFVRHCGVAQDLDVSDPNPAHLGSQLGQVHAAGKSFRSAPADARLSAGEMG